MQDRSEREGEICAERIRLNLFRPEIDFSVRPTKLYQHAARHALDNIIHPPTNRNFQPILLIANLRFQHRHSFCLKNNKQNPKPAKPKACQSGFAGDYFYSISSNRYLFTQSQPANRIGVTLAIFFGQVL